jgi:hypothetical protein
MSLLPKFIIHLTAEERGFFMRIPLRGKPKELLDLLLRHPTDSVPDTEDLRQQLKISNSFFDKISSELLAKSYEKIAPNGGTELLGVLSIRSGLNIHFYKELQKQTKAIKLEPVVKQAAFYKEVIRLILTNLSIVAIDAKVLEELGVSYVKCFKGEDKKKAECYINCKLIFNKTNFYFAKGEVIEHEEELEKEIAKKVVLPKNYDAELLYEYYWLRLYLKFAVEKYDYSMDLAKQTIQLLGKYTDEDTARNLLRIKLKIGELHYFKSEFNEAFHAFEEIFSTHPISKIPENGYYRTKFFQVALITNQLSIAEDLMKYDLKKPGYNLQENYAMRDVITFIKFHLFKGNFDTAHELILLGYEKNPKAKLMQYEIELRNLEVSYFFLTGEPALAVNLCNRNVKFLRSRGIHIKNSDYPFFYLLVKAIFDNKSSGKPLTSKLKTAFERYNRGSFGVYGKLLHLMMQRKI